MEDAAPADKDVGEVPKHFGDAGVPLYSGLELDPQTVVVATRDELARVILIAGPEGSGKTTLLTTLYESFQRGPFSGHTFAGSFTLPAFERLCHFSRIASQRASAETERTPPGEQRRYLHLRLLRDGKERPQDFLFTDLAGEQFRLVSDSEEECRRLTVARRADHVSILADGQKITIADARPTVMNDARRLIRSLLDCDMIGPETLVEVIVSKWDLIASLGPQSDALNYVNNFENELKKLFSARLGRLECTRIAARPEGTQVPFAFGIGELLNLWSQDSLLLTKQPPEIETVLPPSSEFERFATRHERADPT